MKLQTVILVYLSLAFIEDKSTFKAVVPLRWANNFEMNKALFSYFLSSNFAAVIVPCIHDWYINGLHHFNTFCLVNINYVLRVYLRFRNWLKRNKTIESVSYTKTCYFLIATYEKIIWTQKRRKTITGKMLLHILLFSNF